MSYQSTLLIFQYLIQRLVFPEDVAFRIGEDGSNRTNKYFLLETHYDNPEEIANRKFATGVKLFYSDQPKCVHISVNCKIQFEN